MRGGRGAAAKRPLSPPKQIAASSPQASRHRTSSADQRLARQSPGKNATKGDTNNTSDAAATCARLERQAEGALYVVAVVVEQLLQAAVELRVHLAGFGRWVGG